MGNRIFVPDYFCKFSCIADKCRDNCCIGWGVYPDEATLDKYYGELASDKRLSDTLTEDEDGEVCFGRDACGRCLNLTGEGLCRIYSDHGHEALCEICREHPRYYNIYGEYCEGGLSICCEEAARIILGGEGLPDNAEILDEFISGEDCDENALAVAIESRKELFSLLFGKGCISDTLSAILGAGEHSKIMELLSTAAKTLDRLDMLSEELSEKIRRGLRLATDNSEAFIGYLDTSHPSSTRRLAYYYLHRYYLDSSLGLDSKEAYASLVVTLTLITEATAYGLSIQGGEDYFTLAKDISKSVEYCEENIEIILASLYDE